MPPQVLINPPSEAWDSFVSHHPVGHILQTSAWGELKSRFGWSAQRIGWLGAKGLEAGAQVLYRRVPARLGQLAYVPRGPVVDWNSIEQVKGLFAAIERLIRAQGAFALLVEPELPDTLASRDLLSALGFQPAPITIQPPRTIIVDITGSEEALLARMKQKTRYNIRLAMRKGVTVRVGTETDLPVFHHLMRETSERDAFDVHTLDYYEAAYHLFVPSGRAQLLIAEVEREPVAALMVFAVGSRAWYFYGASSNTHREKMPTYLLQWEAIRWARTKGCTSYDLWGVPDEDEHTLEAEFTHREDGLWGVYRFKRGFGGKVVRCVGTWVRGYTLLRHRLFLWMAHRRLGRRRNAGRKGSARTPESVTGRQFE